MLVSLLSATVLALSAAAAPAAAAAPGLDVPAPVLAQVTVTSVPAPDVDIRTEPRVRVSADADDGPRVPGLDGRYATLAIALIVLGVFAVLIGLAVFLVRRGRAGREPTPVS